MLYRYIVSLVFLTVALSACSEIELASPESIASRGTVDQMEEVMKQSLMEFVLRKPPFDVNKKYAKDKTLFLLAVENNDIRMINFLVSKGAEIVNVDSDGNTAIHLATLNPDNSIINYLLSNGFDMRDRNNEGRTPLSFAILQNMPLDRIKFLLDNGANPNDWDNEDMSALFHAIDSGKSIAYINTLLKYGASRNWKDIQGRNAFMHAVQGQSLNMDLVNLLLRGSLSLDIKDEKEGLYIIHYAIDRETPNVELIRLLIEYGVDTYVVTDDNWSPLHYVMNYTYPSNVEEGIYEERIREIAVMLIENGSFLNLRAGDEHLSPLIIAIRNNRSLETIELLVNMGASVYLPDKFGRTPLHIAVITSGQEATVDYLVEKGSDLGSTDYEGNTPVHIALRYSGDIQSIKSLLHKGGYRYLNVENHNGRRPTDLVFLNPHLRGDEDFLNWLTSITYYYNARGMI